MFASRVISGRSSDRAAAQIRLSNVSRPFRDSSADKDLIERQIEWVKRGIAEQIVEKRARRASEIDAGAAREQCALPYDCRRNVEHGFLALATREE
jgi:hypothetical protein